MMELKMQLCAGRHSCPDAVDGAIFPEVVEEMFNFDKLWVTAVAKIPRECTHLIVYVTGLTPCLCAVIEYCNDAGIALTCAHYDRESGTYKMQRVL